MSYTPLELAEAFIKTGELADALEALDAHLASSPGDEAGLRLRAAVRLRTGSLAQALADVESLAAPTADDHQFGSVILERMGNLDAAIRAMELARDLQPHDERCTERLIGLLMKAGRTQESQTIVEQMPKTWRWRQWAGDISVQSGDDERAVTYYDDALAILAQHFDLSTDKNAAAIQARLLLARADACSRLERHTAAEADYLAAANIIPDDPLIPFKRGLLAAARGELDAAVTLCREALSSANPTLRASMEAELQLPHYRELAEKL